jgi:hypothetical protein
MAAQLVASQVGLSSISKKVSKQVLNELLYTKILRQLHIYSKYEGESVNRSQIEVKQL